MKESALLESTISEYETMLTLCTDPQSRRLDIENLVRDLSQNHDWTDQGAEALITLANDYGAFMLRNALALAVALNKEDGDLGF